MTEETTLPAPCPKCGATADGRPTRRELVSKDEGFELQACDCAGKDQIFKRRPQ
jgi:hypothetical protein